MVCYLLHGAVDHAFTTSIVTNHTDESVLGGPGASIADLGRHRDVAQPSTPSCLDVYSNYIESSRMCVVRLPSTRQLGTPCSPIPCHPAAFPTPTRVVSANITSRSANTSNSKHTGVGQGSNSNTGVLLLLPLHMHLERFLHPFFV